MRMENEAEAVEANSGISSSPKLVLEALQKFKWAGNQEAVTFLGYRPIRP
jgi:hypothetical protein